MQGNYLDQFANLRREICSKSQLTLNASHMGKTIICTTESNIEILVGVGLPNDFYCRIISTVAGGVVTIVPRSGASVGSVSGSLVINDRYGSGLLSTIGNNQYLFDSLAAGSIVAYDLLRSYLVDTVTYNNTDSLSNTPLSVNVEAGGIYKIELVLYSTSAVRALNADFGGTATITNFVGDWLGVNGGDFFVDGNGSHITAAGTDYSNSALDGVSDVTYTFTGSVEINAAGTFLLRGAQNAASVSNTTILRGSTLVLTKMN